MQECRGNRCAFYLRGTGWHLFFCAAVPVPRVWQVAFDAVKPGMNPCAFAIVFDLDNFVG